jgi:hypothetical protein
LLVYPHRKEEGDDMAPPVKYKTSTVLFSYRAEKDMWQKIKEIAHRRGESLTEVFDRLTLEYYEKYKDLLVSENKELLKRMT